MMPRQRNWALKFSTLVVVTACFVVVGAAFLAAQNLRNVLTLWGEDVQMTVYLAQDMSDQGRAFVENKIRQTPEVAEIKFVTQDQALSDFRVQMASYAPDITQDEELLKLIPASLQVKLSPDLAVADQMPILQNLSAQLRGLEGVEEVSYGQDWVARYSTLVKTFEVTLQILGLVIVLAALFVISNAVRASVASRKEEIVVLEMIGATYSMIRRPFLIEGAFLGLSASLIAIVICFGIYIGIKNLVTSQLQFLQLGEHLQFLNIGAWLAFVLVGTGLGALASYLCVRRMNDGYSGRQGLR